SPRSILGIPLLFTLERFAPAARPSQLALKLRWNVSAWEARRKSSGSRRPRSFTSRSETTENQFLSNHEKACLHHRLDELHLPGLSLPPGHHCPPLRYARECRTGIFADIASHYQRTQTGIYGCCLQKRHFFPEAYL